MKTYFIIKSVISLIGLNFWIFLFFQSITFESIIVSLCIGGFAGHSFMDLIHELSGEEWEILV